MDGDDDISNVETRPTRAVDASPEVGTPYGPEVGQSLGRYIVIEQVGDGGMGRVLRAYDPKLEREVALKLLHTDALDADAQARLVREARAMAMLSHPNVVPVHDVDDTPSGVMLVMELVRGQTLRMWLRQRDHPWSEIVARFVEAGRGLAAAHAAGLLHRDFKPSNVLVPEHGAAKVTDFGLAKLDSNPDTDVGDPRSPSSPRVSLDGPLTAVGEVLGTPRYMAPEQHRGLPLSPAVDQYAFCVALWEALTDKAPFVGRWRELEARKHQGPPAWPSGIAVPSSLVEALRRGLAVEPSGRWPSMDALLDALTPVARRGRWGVAASGLVALAVAAAGWRSWAQDRVARCSGAQVQLEGVWDPARRKEVMEAMGRVAASYAVRAREQTAESLDRYADGWVEMHTETCEATTVRGDQSTAVMDLRMACLQRAKLELRAVTAVLADADAQVVQNAHELLAGLRPLSRCADLEALQAEVEPPSSQEAAAVAEIRALLAEATALHLSGRYAAAQLEIDAGRERLAELDYGPVHTEVMLLDGTNLEHLGKLEASEAALRRALDLAARSQQLDAMQTAAVRLMHVVGYEEQRMDEGLQQRELALGLAAGDPSREATARTALANVLQRQGKYDQAEAELRLALTGLQSAVDFDPLEVAMSRNTLANVLQLQGRYDDAEAEHRSTLALREQVLGPEHPDVAMSRNNLANVLRRQGRYPEAEAELRRALATNEDALGPEHPAVGLTRNGLGNVLYAEGKYEEAEAELYRAVTMMEKALGPDHPNVAVARSNLGNTLLARGKHEEAAAEYLRGITLMEETLGPDHPNTATLRTNYAEALFELGDHHQAETEHRRALLTLENALGPEHPDLATSRVFLAATLGAQGKHEAAEGELRLSLSRLEAALGADHGHVAMARSRLAEVLLERGRTTEALELAELAWSRRQRYDTPPAERAETAFVLARALLANDPGALARGRSLVERAIEDWGSTAGAHAGEAQRAGAWLRDRDAP